MPSRSKVSPNAAHRQRPRDPCRRREAVCYREETPVVDGGGVRAAMERWALRLADDNQPGIWSRKHILLVPSLNHSGLTKAFRQYTEEVHAADARIYDPNAPILFSLKRMADQSFRLIFPAAGTAGVKRDEEMFKSADIIAGDMGAIRRYSPASLKAKPSSPNTLLTKMSPIYRVAMHPYSSLPCRH